jgi:hypothetical protein
MESRKPRLQGQQTERSSRSSREGGQAVRGITATNVIMWVKTNYQSGISDFRRIFSQGYQSGGHIQLAYGAEVSVRDIRVKQSVILDSQEHQTARYTKQ